MVAVPNVALELPLHVLVREERPDQTIVSFRPMADLLERAGVPLPMVHRLDPAQRILVGTLGR